LKFSVNKPSYLLGIVVPCGTQQGNVTIECNDKSIIYKVGNKSEVQCMELDGKEVFQTFNNQLPIKILANAVCCVKFYMPRNCSSYDISSSSLQTPRQAVITLLDSQIDFPVCGLLLKNA
jgi:hypothetical protein